MFTYKNHRFHIVGFTFSIPDGYALDQVQEEEYQDEMKMVSPDGSIIISVRPYYNVPAGHRSKDAFYMINEFLDDCADSFEVIEPIKPISRGGIQGYYAA